MNIIDVWLVFHDLINYFQIMSRKWAFPFLKPVDAEALELYDYHEVMPYSKISLLLSLPSSFIFIQTTISLTLILSRL
jgi:hypothetical protein